MNNRVKGWKMKIPRGTLRNISLEAGHLFLRGFWGWLKYSLPWWGFISFVYFFYLNNPTIEFLGDKSPGVFFIVDFVVTATVALVLVLSVIVIILNFEFIDKGRQSISVLQGYRTALKLFWPLLKVQIAYLWRILCGFLKIFVPGIFAFTDGFGCCFSFLVDQKQGKDAVIFSEKVVQVQRNRYWDYLLMGFLVSLMFFLPVLVFIDQLAYIARSHQFFYVSTSINGLKYVALYFSVVYFLVFHYCVYKKFKTFLPSS